MLGVCSAPFAQNPSPPPNPESEQFSAQDASLQVLASGPIHEAFAEPVVFDPQPGATIKMEPREPIEELPPDQKPAGTDVAWIPGYWGWDDDRDDFIWISGLWRELPPGREWVPGYWATASDGHQWVSGYWSSTESASLDYLAEPPESLETGPATPSPSDNHIWVPGCWQWNEARYMWRPGYWIAAQPDWLWMPAHYVWTPGGYVFVDGFWDYPVQRRGLLFAPIYFGGGVVVTTGYQYTPRYCVNTTLLTDHLFVWPRYNRYYFGDYYATNYTQAGIVPWFAFNQSHIGFDPIFANYSHHHRVDRDWDQRQRNTYEQLREREADRPARIVVRDSGPQKLPGSVEESLVVRLDQTAALKDSPIRLEKVDDQQRLSIAERTKGLREFTRQRSQMEGESVTQNRAPLPKETATPKEGQKGVPKVRQPNQRERARSPISSSSESKESKAEAAPARPKTPELDPKIEPNKTPRRGKRTGGPQPDSPKTNSDRPRIKPQTPGTNPLPDKPGAAPVPKKPNPLPPAPKIDPKVPIAPPTPPKGEPKRPNPLPIPSPDESKPEKPKKEPGPPPPESKPEQPERKVPPAKREPEPKKPKN